MFRFPKWPLAKKPDEPIAKLTDGVLGTQIAEIMNAIAETLAKSCLYFTPENLAVLGSGPDVSPMLERMDPLLRATLLDGTMRPEPHVNFRAVAKSADDLYAGAEAARLAAQLFRILNVLKTPNSGLAPVKKVTDSAIRTLRTSASAVSSSDESGAKMALKSFAETEALGKELLELLPSLATYRSPTMCRLIAAALYSILVSTQSAAEVASNLLVPSQAKIEPLEELDSLAYVTRLYQGNSVVRADVVCMPVNVKRR